MRDAAILLGGTLLASAPSSARARADKSHAVVCAPACPEPFVCAPDGRCVSACNPPCAAREQCLPDGSCADRAPSGPPG